MEAVGISTCGILFVLIGEFPRATKHTKVGAIKILDVLIISGYALYSPATMDWVKMRSQGSRIHNLSDEGERCAYPDNHFRILLFLNENARLK